MAAVGIMGTVKADAIACVTTAAAVAKTSGGMVLPFKHAHLYRTGATAFDVAKTIRSYGLVVSSCDRKQISEWEVSAAW